MPFGMHVVGMVDVIVVWVALTVTVTLVGWAAIVPHHDQLPEMFSPRDQPLELLIW